jgi:hypothetical protein
LFAAGDEFADPAAPPSPPPCPPLVDRPVPPILPQNAGYPARGTVMGCRGGYCRIPFVDDRPRKLQGTRVCFDDKLRVHSAGWTDAITLDAKCTSPCEADAQAFIKFYVSEATTMALLPAQNLPPRDLLPRRKSLYASKDLLAKAPLYSQLWNLTSTTSPG